MRTIISVVSLFVFFGVILADQAEFDPESDLSPLYPNGIIEPTCISSGSDGRVYVAANEGVVVLEPNSTDSILLNEKNVISGGVGILRAIIVHDSILEMVGENGYKSHNLNTDSDREITLQPLPSKKCLTIAMNGLDPVIGTDKGLTKQGVVFHQDTAIKKTAVLGEETWNLSPYFISSIKGDEVTSYSKEDIGNTTDMCVDAKEKTPWASLGGEICFFDGQEWVQAFERGNDPSVISNLIVDGYGVVWGFAYKSDGSKDLNFLFRYNTSSGRRDYYDLAKLSIEVEDVQTVHAALGLDHKGRMMIAGNNGWRYVTNNNSPVIMRPRIARSSGVRFTEKGFYIPFSANISFESYTLSGRPISKISGFYNAGEHSISSSFSKTAAGQYVVRLTARDKTITSRAMALR